ncbi:hypothetical protein EROM_040200 [Encephalitozoon romaleae SJ-2008]|uniref:Uncharacterized protein n=1 Tax=Encephalitozoon romaleae (strain SJ-2008) TaxID=1178016 RepID=I7AM75_ENCRO|nr:hypothetical protein EROM_040200 [Encephalitozoon romaleae SJ-2008]AFN82789.1 hypothetical protein EROM_040200 [Encephalitozoon romaleae SJ-2008]
MMTFDGMDEDELENALLNYIDIPYFRNNPSYISLWQRYYYKTNDPSVLFLMKYKKISQYYHWIYVELSRFFMRNGRYGVCKAVLNVGIACNAYEREVLEDELQRIPMVTNPSPEHEINTLLNPKGFTALGKVWNSYQEVLFYNRKLFLLDQEEVSFEEYRAKTYSGKSRLSLKKYGIKLGIGHMGENDPVDGMSNTLSVGKEIVIDGYVYYVKDVMDGNRYRMICISDGNFEELMYKGDVILHEVPKSSIDLIQRLDSDHVPRFTVKELGSRTFLLYDFYVFGTLESCLDISNSMKSGIVLYFVSQLIEIFGGLEERGCRFTAFSLESLCVSEDCRLKIVDFDLSEDGSKMNYGEVIKGVLLQYSSFPFDEQGVVQGIRGILQKTDLKGLVTKLRIHLYERICKCC